MEEVGLACLPEDLDLIKKRIGEQGLNRIVIAGCSRWEIRGAMEEMAKGMGFNPTLIEYANIREQCAFVHEDYPELATEKAMALIKMAVERARRIQPIRRGKQKVEKKGVGGRRRTRRYDRFSPTGGTGIRGLPDREGERTGWQSEGILLHLKGIRPQGSFAGDD